MSRLCSRANFAQVKLCALIAVIGKSLIFPITEKRRVARTLQNHLGSRLTTKVVEG